MAKASGNTARIVFMAALVAGGMIMANPAQAGFEFKPPPKPQAQSKNQDMAPPAPAVPAAPVDTVTLPDGDMPMQPLPDVSPVPTGQMPAMQTSVKIAPAPKPVEAVMAPAPSPVMTPPRPPVSAVAAAPLAPAYTTVDGFGNDMPLALALRQIVPPTYAYSFDKAVNPGQRVNWTGGRPWNDVLNDALVPHGLKATIMANSVRIDPAAGPTPAADQMAIPVPPPAMPSSFTGVKQDQGMSYLTYARKPSEQKDWSSEGTASYPRHEPAKHDGMDQMPAAAPMPPPSPLPVASPVSMATPPLPPVPAASTSAIHTQAPEAIFAESPSAPVPRLPIPESSISRQEDTTYVWPANTDTSAPPPPSMMQPLPPPITSGHSSISRQDETLSSAKQVKADQQPVLAALPNDGMDTIAALPAPAPALTPAPAEPKQAPMTVAAVKSAPVPAKILAVPPAAIEPAAGGQNWNAQKGQSLKLVLEDWAQKSGTELYWNSITDYKLPQDIHASASFTDAVQQVLSLYQTEPDRPVGSLHKAGSGANKLVIDSWSARSSAPEKKPAKAG